jgi:hypothetical protein
MKNQKNLLWALLVGSFILVSCETSNSKEATSSKPDSEGTTESEPMSEKKELLSSLIGEHPLQSISGFMGANTMVDYIKENGKWSASGSSLSAGMREPFDINLSQAYLKSLNSMKIKVGDDLSVSLLCNGKEYFKTPFIENGLGYYLKKSPKDYSSGMSEKLTPESTFLDESLYLYAKDFISENEMNKINVAEVMADAVVITYNTKSKQFEMNLFLGECCDNATYVFN